MLVPIGLDHARLSRWPWVSTAIVILCVLAFLGSSFSGADRQAEAAMDQAMQYLLEHPYLEPPRSLTRFRLRLPREAAPEGLAAQVEREQAHLDELGRAFAAALDATPVFRYSVVRAHGVLQPGWITYQFMHGSLGHLLGNLIIFVLLVGPFLEDAWGAVFFTAFYLVGGVVAALAQLPWLGPETPLLGASGAISACLGAFALRFAHRRVRMFYWWFAFLRGTFFVPAWAYAFFGFGMDLLGLRLSGEGGGVAYACHVGGFAFGAAVALVVRQARLEERLSPEGAVRWRDGLDANRAAEALADGDVAGARARLQDAVRKRPADDAARLELARIDAGRLDLDAVTEGLEPVLARRLAAGDAEGTRSLVAEFQDKLRADRLRPATAYRVAELVERGDEPFALALYQAAGAAGGGLGVKALVKAAQLLAPKDPGRARELLERAELAASGAEAKARIQGLVAALPSASGPPAGVATGGDLAAGGPVLRELWCRLTAVHGGTLDVVDSTGRAGRIQPARIALVAASLIERMRHPGGERANGVILDLLLHARPGQPQVLVRLAGHEMGLAAVRPGIPPARAFAELVEAILVEGAAAPWPDPTRVQGRPFARYPDLAAYEQACFGRALAAPAIAGTG